MSVSSRHEDVERPLIALINQTTQDPARSQHCVEAIGPILDYRHQLEIQNLPSPHRPFHPAPVNPAQVEMPQSSQPHCSDQRRTSSSHSSRTNTVQGMGSAHTISTNASQMNAGFASASNAGQTGPPSYAASEPNASSPTFPFDPVSDRSMPSARPELGHMIVSVNRQKIVSDDMDWTTQFPLEDLRSSTTGDFSINQLSYSRLLGEISEKIRSNVESEGNSVVWVMSNDNQLGIVRDTGSLRAAVLDHQIAGKHIIQLYVVKEKAEGIVLPESQVISSKTFILPKAPAAVNGLLSPDPTLQQEDTPRQPSSSSFGKAFGH
ncbi:hypothetical protein QM012_004927 [Aureobasidium pullulans]|uniref:Uncharacterized protein n=1 Tax=Aureobasidium pullulans TaxID=5580 RepID=A0ABR0T5X2_AURPU